MCICTVISADARCQVDTSLRPLCTRIHKVFVAPFSVYVIESHDQQRRRIAESVIAREGREEDTQYVDGCRAAANSCLFR